MLGASLSAPKYQAPFGPLAGLLGSAEQALSSIQGLVGAGRAGLLALHSFLWDYKIMHIKER